MLKIDQLCGTLGLKFPWARSPTAPRRKKARPWPRDVQPLGNRCPSGCLTSAPERVSIKHPLIRQVLN